ncbi:VWA domain-containing protein [bacterium]|nr:VWA domain-containing protein [bacterium]
MFSKNRCFLILLFFILVQFSFGADEINEVNLHFVDASRFPVNFIYYTTQDAEGNYSEALWEDNLEIMENGRMQKIHTQDEEEALPSSVVMILDSSGSMKNTMEGVLSAAATLVGELGSNDKAKIIDFDSTVKVKSSFTGDKDKLYSVLKTIQADGGTALYDAVKDGTGHAEDLQGLKAIVLLTDGKDENAAGTGPGSETTLAELKNILKDSQMPVYSIGLGEGVDKETLDTLSEISGGKAYYADSTEAVSEIYGEIIKYLHSLHRMWYSTSNGKFDGTQRDIQFVHKHEDIEESISYTAPEAKFWSHAFNLEEGTVDKLGITPDGGRITVLDIRALFTPEGKRLYTQHWEDIYPGVLTEHYMVAAKNQEYGVFYEYDDEGVEEVNIQEMLSSADGDFHSDWEWKAKAISKNEKYMVFCSYQSEAEYHYNFMLYDLGNNRVMWEKTLYKGEFEEPGEIAVSDNGISLITQDLNLFALNQEGEILFEKMSSETNKRFYRLSITGDGTRFIARIEGKDRVEVFDMDGNVLWSVDSENNEKGGMVYVSANGEYYGINDKFGPRIYDKEGNILFSERTENPVNCYANGIAVADDGSYVYSLSHRFYYGKIEN